MTSIYPDIENCVDRNLKQIALSIVSKNDVTLEEINIALSKCIRANKKKQNQEEKEKRLADFEKLKFYFKTH